MEIQEKKTKRIVFDVNIETHQLIKIQAARRNISMNAWLMRAISERLARENKDENSNM